MDRRQIIMNFSIPPSLEDMEVIAAIVLETIPSELARICEDIVVRVEDFPDETVERDMELETPYELLALFRSGNQISPGIVSKVKQGENTLILYRRPILDAWCESGDDLNALVREVMVIELAQSLDFSDEEIEEMTLRAAS